MREKLSLWLLLVHASLGKLLLLLLGGGVLQGALFAAAFAKTGLGNGSGLGEALSRSGLPWVSAALLIGTTVLLCRPFCGGGGKPGYTLSRLSVPPRGFFLRQAAYNILCYFLVWAIQLLVALACCLWALRGTPPEPGSSQILFLTFYRSSYLHSLLPLQEVSHWIRNGVFLFGLGVAAACFPIRRRREDGEKGIAIFLMVPMVIVTFSAYSPTLAGDLLFGLIVGIGALLAAAGIWMEGALS